MHCPYCGHDNSWVVDTRLIQENNTTRRRRECTNKKCEKRFTTYEHIEYTYPKVIKKRRDDNEQKIQPFDRSKIMRAVRVSVGAGCADEDVHMIVESVCRRVLRSHDKTIESDRIADLVMEEIGKYSPVGHVRFACEYMDLSSIKELKEFIQRIEHSKRGKRSKPPKSLRATPSTDT